MIKTTTRDKILDATFLLVYKYGYASTSTTMVINECGVPKGCLYHHFKSKKDLVLAVLKERIEPKINDFFRFEKSDEQNAIDSIIKSIKNIASNEYLVKYGCPLNRLNQEMGNIDVDFEQKINIIYDDLVQKIVNILSDTDIKNKDNLAQFIVNSTWGALSLSSKQASKKRFLNNISHLTNYLLTFKK